MGDSHTDGSAHSGSKISHKTFVSPFSKRNTANVRFELTFGHKITLPQLNIKTKQNVLSVE